MLISIMAGIALGLSVALPFGPISLVCVQRSIDYGYRHGFVTGAGAASAQGIFATAVLASRDVISPDVVVWSGALRWLSAGLLMLFGLRTLMRQSPLKTPTALPGARASYLSSLALALSNPMTILPYIAVASEASGAETTDALLSSWFVPGVVAGAATWYALLSAGASMFHTGLPGKFRRRLNLLAGVMLMTFGMWVAIR